MIHVSWVEKTLISPLPMVTYSLNCSNQRCYISSTLCFSCLLGLRELQFMDCQSCTGWYQAYGLEEQWFGECEVSPDANTTCQLLGHPKCDRRFVQSHECWCHGFVAMASIIVRRVPLSVGLCWLEWTQQHKRRHVDVSWFRLLEPYIQQ
jgi:hypothetical protein